MVNRDEYLLGRPIDKYVFEKMEEKEAGCSSETGLLPGSIFAPSGANSLLDMASKIREDPLFIIRYWRRAGEGFFIVAELSSRFPLDFGLLCKRICLRLGSLMLGRRLHQVCLI